MQALLDSILESKLQLNKFYIEQIQAQTLLFAESQHHYKLLVYTVQYNHNYKW